MKPARLALVTMLLAGALATPLAAQDTGGAPIVIAGKLDTATDLLLMPVRFGDASVWCAVDTGFSALLVIDRQKAEAIGIAIQRALPLPDGTPPKTTDGSASAEVRVGPVSLGRQNVIIRDLPDEAPDMECVFGTAQLRQFVIEMDHQEPQVRLIPHQAFMPAPGSVEVPLVFRSNPNVAFVRVTFRFADGTEQPAQLLADSGAANYAALVVDPVASRIRPLLGALAQVTNTPKGPSGPLKLSAARPTAIIVGPITIEQPVIALLESDFGSGGFDDGLLGAGFFRRFTVAFDYLGRRMLVRPNAHVADAHPFDASGAGVRQEAALFVVEKVLPDTAAARAGLRVGDTIVSVDGRPAGSFTHAALRHSLSRPGETRTLGVRRDGALLSIAIVLTKRL
jgi:predicted aspartyl protease